MLPSDMFATRLLVPLSKSWLVLVRLSRDTVSLALPSLKPVSSLIWEESTVAVLILMKSSSEAVVTCASYDIIAVSISEEDGIPV